MRHGILLLAALQVMSAAGWTQSVDRCLSPTIVVNVRDQQGKVVPGLTPESFHVKAGDSLLAVKSAQTGAGHRVVLLVDISGSISKSEHGWQLARVLAGNLLVAGPATARVALVLFSDHIVDTIGFDQLASEIVERLAKMENGKGRTALLDSLDYSADLLHTPETGDAVYIVTDGLENSSKAHKRDVEAKFLARGIRLFAFVLYDQYMGLPLNPDEGPALLSDLAEATGGLVVDADAERSSNARERLKTELNLAYNQMAQFYALQLSIPGRWAKKQRLRLEIVDQDGKKRKDVNVSYPQYLLPCPH